MRQKYAVHNTMVDSVEVVEADAVDPRELNAIQLEYEKWRKKSKPIPKQIQFDYSWSLIRTKDKKLIAKGVALLSDLYRLGSEAEKREYVYYLAVGNAKLDNLVSALRFCDAILTLEPKNHQAMALRRFVRAKMVRDGIIGMAVFLLGVTAVGLCIRRVLRGWR